MTRTALVALGLAAAGLVVLALLGLAGRIVMPSYLGGWLVILALPLGALPIVMGWELLGLPETLPADGAR